MKAAFAYWSGRIAPLFDASARFWLVTAHHGRIAAHEELCIQAACVPLKAARLTKDGVQELICGGLSRAALWALLAQGVEVQAFISGDVRDVIKAWLRNEPLNARFAMPGCVPGKETGQVWEPRPERHRHRNGARAREPAVRAMKRAWCICPSCGHVEPHRRGLPCVERSCRMCGSVLVRH